MKVSTRAGTIWEVDCRMVAGRARFNVSARLLKGIEGNCKSNGNRDKPIPFARPKPAVPKPPISPPSSLQATVICQLTGQGKRNSFFVSFRDTVAQVDEQGLHRIREFGTERQRGGDGKEMGVNGREWE